MLGKVMKYENRSLARLMAPVFGLGLGAALVLRLLMWLVPLLWPAAGHTFVTGAAGLGMMAMAIVLAVAFVALVYRYYQSTVTSEAYLTFTLPVKTSTHIWGRLLVACLWFLLAVVVALLGGWLLLGGLGAEALGLSTITINGTTYPFSYVFPLGTRLAFFAGIALVALVTFAFAMLQVYASFAIGAQFRSRLLFSALAYFALNSIESLLSAPLAMIPLFTILGRQPEQFVANLERYFDESLFLADPGAFFSRLWGFVGIVFGITLVVGLVFAVAHYLITVHFVGKKLNLE